MSQDSPLSAAVPFVTALSTGDPTPGGGSAAALVGALGAALVEMVTHLTLGRSKYADVAGDMEALRGRAEAMRAHLNALVEQDAAAYDGFSRAMKLPRETDEQRTARKAALAQAALDAAEVPLRTMRACFEVLELTVPVSAKGNRNAVSDGGCAALLARAALRAAHLNVRVNLPYVKDDLAVERLRNEAADLERRAAEFEQQALAATGLLK